MDIINLSMNMEDMEDFEALPAGLYPAEIRDVEIKTSDNSPNGYFAIGLRIDPDDFPADYDVANAPEGMNLTYARVAMPDPNNRRTVNRFRALIKACGLPFQGSDFDPQTLVGKSVGALLAKNFYQGQEVNNVDALSEIAEV